MKFSLKNRFRSTVLLAIVFTASCKVVAPIKSVQKLTLSDGSQFVAKSYYPKFSWDVTPMYYMFGDNVSTLTSTEVEFISKRTDFLCIEKSHAINQLGSAELGAKWEAEAFKKLKKGNKTLFYFNSAYAYPFTSYTKNFAPNKIDQYPDLKDFLIEDEKTGELAKRGTVYFFDVLKPKFRDWWVATVVQGVKDSKTDGVFIDQMHGFVWLRPSKSAEVREAMGQMMASLKKELGAYKILLGNNAKDPNAQLAYQAVDAIMFEHYNKDILSKEALLKNWEDMREVAKDGKISIFRIGVEADPFDTQSETYYKGPQKNDKYEALSKERLNYFHACYLIGAQPYSYFQYGWGWQLASGSLVDYPSLQKSLGHPNGDYKRLNLNGWEFSREFEHASVWLDTQNGKANITWK